MPDLVKHVIEASNPIFGQSQFLTLKLSEAWDLAPGVGRPEIVASHQRGDIRWVANGEFWYVVFNREQRWAMEFRGRMRPAGGRTADTGETVSAGGHPARVRWTTRRRGLPWKRHDVTFMRVEFACPQSERRLELEFSGWCPEHGFREVLAALAGLRCH